MFRPWSRRDSHGAWRRLSPNTREARPGFWPTSLNSNKRDWL